MKHLLLLLLLLAVAVQPAESQRHSRGSGRHDVHVGGYYRKNGTYVHSHDRAAPGLGTHKSSSPRSYNHRSTSRSTSSYRSTMPSSSTHRSSKRSKAARDAFEREHPCPSTGKRSGRCPGYVVDHVKALACGGADAPSNMQWQTAEAGKAKDKSERIGCR